MVHEEELNSIVFTITSDLYSERDQEWAVLYDKIQEVLRPLGQEDRGELQGGTFNYVDGDYLLVKDDWGNFRHRIETSSLEFIKPAVIASLRQLLIGYPNWEIVLTVGASESENRPAMGLVIRDDEIIDGLQREYLPNEFRNIYYEGSRSLGSRFGDIMYT